MTDPTPRSGSIDDAIAGNYELDIGTVFSEAWQYTKGFKLKYWGALILFYIIIFLVAVGLGLIFGFGTVAGTGAQAGQPANLGSDVALQAIIQIVLMLILYPLMAGFIMMGIHQVSNQEVSIGQLFGYFDRIFSLFFLGLAMTILIFIGFLLLIIPGIYLSVAYYFAIPLMVDKKLGIWQSMEISRKAVTKHWFLIFGIMILFGLLVMVSAIPLGLGLIWTLPMSLTIIGVMYRIIFGAGAQEESQESQVTEPATSPQ